MAKIFENVVCSRCGGTGHYSYNQVDGSKCFKCHGSKTKLTPRGEAAQNYYNELITIKASSVEVGDKIIPMSFERAGEVTEIHIDSSGRLFITVNNCSYGMSNASTVKVAVAGDERQKNLDLALLFQSKLTKAGKLMKKHQ
jgi:ribosomal protein L40E